MKDITIIVLTKNEELNIENCIKSVKEHATRVCVIDSGSEDQTCLIAKSLGADVYYNKFINHSSQFNWALDNVEIKTKWVMKLDADERIPELLWDELDHLMNESEQNDVNGIVLEAWLYFLGKKLRFGGSKKRKLMVFKFGTARIENRRMDEHAILNSGKSIYARNKFIHYDFKNINHFFNKLNWYATKEMQDYLDSISNSNPPNLGDKQILKTRYRKFKIYYKFPRFIRSSLLFIYFYYFKLGFLDGKIGYIYNYSYHRMYRQIVDFKIYEHIRNNSPIEEVGDLR